MTGEWVPISSMALEAAMYNAERRELHIRFLSGRSYTYEDVDPTIYEGLLSASSPGAYFHSVIKPLGVTQR